MSLVGKLVTVKVLGLNVEPRWEGRVTSETDHHVEVVVDPPEGTRAFADVCKRSPEIRLEYVENQTAYESSGEIERYATRFPCAVLVRIGATVRAIQRRRHPRIPTHLPVHVSVNAGTSSCESTGDGTVVNLSLGGAAISTMVPLKVGDRVSLSFTPGRVVSPTGRVVRVQNDGKAITAGIEFITVSDQDLGGLHSFISNSSSVA